MFYSSRASLGSAGRFRQIVKARLFVVEPPPTDATDD